MRGRPPSSRGSYCWQQPIPIVGAWSTPDSAGNASTSNALGPRAPSVIRPDTSGMCGVQFCQYKDHVFTIYRPPPPPPPRGLYVTQEWVNPAAYQPRLTHIPLPSLTTEGVVLGTHQPNADSNWKGIAVGLN